MMGKNHIITNFSSVIGFHTSLKLLEQSYGSQIPLIGSVVRFNEDLLFRGCEVPLWVNLSLVACFLLIGSILPDIDSPNSLLGKYLHLSFFKHRGWLHTIWFILPFFVCGFYFSPLLWLSLGMFLHLFWDNLSYGGICFFRPNYITYSSGAMVKRGHWLKLYRVGDISETIIVSLIVIFTIVIVYFGFKNGIYSI